MPSSTRKLPLVAGSLMLFFWLVVGLLPASAIHLLGGEMSYKFLDANGPVDKPWRYELTLRLYTNPSTDIENSNVVIKIYNRYATQPYGPALASLFLTRLSTTPVSLPALPGCGAGPPPVSLGLYSGVVNMAVNNDGYLAVCSTGNRIVGITNLFNSVSDGIGFNLTLQPASIPNSSPVYSNVPVSLMCAGTPTVVANNAFDPDGDELVYEPAMLFYANGYSITQPFGAAGSLTLDPQTGISRYLSPNQGIYQLAFDVSEYRVINGVRQLLSKVRRDMQVVVRTCVGTSPGSPPAFTPASLVRTNFQIREGETVEFPVAATDPDGDALTLTASSALLDGPGGIEASFGGQPGTAIAANPTGQASVRGTGSVTGTFRLTGCGPGRALPYEVVLTATDESCNRQTVVARFLITVLRPAFAGTISGVRTACSQSLGTYSVANASNPPYQWSAVGGQVLGSATGPTATVLWGATGPGKVLVSSLTPQGCPTQPAELPVTITPGLPLSGPTAYCLTGATGLRYSVAGPRGTYQWTVTDGTITAGQGTNEVVVDIRPGATATVQVANSALSSCVSILRVAPDENCLYFYNIITPNGDGQNERFVITNLERHPRTALTVFNRWGQQVYQSTDYDNSYAGQGQAAGVYYYFCQLADGTRYKGWFEIIR